MSGDDGIAYFGGLHRPSFLVTAEMDGYVPSDSLEIHPNPDRPSHLTASLLRLGALELEVINQETGRPARGVAVILINDEGTSTEEEPRLTSKAGLVHFRRLVPGDYVLNVGDLVEKEIEIGPGETNKLRVTIAR